MVLERGHFVVLGTILGRPFLSASPIAGPFLLVGEERSEDPIVLAS